MASAFPPTNNANANNNKPVTEKKKRKRPSKKVPTTVLESSSTNFMDLVQKLTGSEAELGTGTTNDGEKRLKPDLVPEITSYGNLHNAIATSFNDNDSSSSSHSTYTPAGSPFPAQHPDFMDAMDPMDPTYAGALGADDDNLCFSGYYTAASNSTSTSRATENDISPFSSSWRDPTSHSDYWYQQMDAMRA